MSICLSSRSCPWRRDTSATLNGPYLPHLERFVSATLSPPKIGHAKLLNRWAGYCSALNSPFSLSFLTQHVRFRHRQKGRHYRIWTGRIDGVLLARSCHGSQQWQSHSFGTSFIWEERDARNGCCVHIRRQKEGISNWCKLFFPYHGNTKWFPTYVPTSNVITVWNKVPMRSFMSGTGVDRYNLLTL